MTKAAATTAAPLALLTGFVLGHLESRAFRALDPPKATARQKRGASKNQ